MSQGGLAILGAVALLVKKGGTIHRRSGLLFVYAMVVLGASASILGFRKSPTDGNVFGGLMTVYFVGTALTTVRPASPWTRGINVAALVVAVGLALVDIVGGANAFNSPGGFRNGVPFQMLFFIAAVMILAAIGDMRMMRFGMPHGGPRLARHLWRMCFALFIAAGSFFSIRERVATILPEPFTTAPMRALPTLLAFRRDVRLAVEGARPAHVASARPTRFDATRPARQVDNVELSAASDYAARINQLRKRAEQPANSQVPHESNN